MEKELVEATIESAETVAIKGAQVESSVEIVSEEDAEVTKEPTLQASESVSIAVNQMLPDVIKTHAKPLVAEQPAVETEVELNKPESSAPSFMEMTSFKITKLDLTLSQTQPEVQRTIKSNVQTANKKTDASFFYYYFYSFNSFNLVGHSKQMLFPIPIWDFFTI